MPTTRRPKLGQHFLASLGYRQRIIKLLPLREDDLVLEIGPGRGGMTELLAKRVTRVVAIELDAKLASELEQRLEERTGIEVLHGDILALDVAGLCRGRGVEKCFVFGNLPYYITSPIIRHLMDYAGSIRGMGLLVQREVAMRITAQPDSRDYGYLTALAQIHSEPRIALQVPAGAFSPPPKVQSALVNFRMRPKFPAWPAETRAQFLGFVRQCFAQKRKTLVNNLGSSYGREHVARALAALGLPPTARAEGLALEKFAELLGHLK